MSIYPVIPGQRTSDWNIIPPGGHLHPHPQAAEKQAQASAPQGETQDLIDFGQNDTNTQAQTTHNAPASPPLNKTGSKEIATILQSTGQKAEDGPLLDFTSDLMNDLPPAKGNLRKEDTADSNNTFFDAEG